MPAFLRTGPFAHFRGLNPKSARPAACALALQALTYVGRRRLLPEERHYNISFTEIAWAVPEIALTDRAELGVELVPGGLRFTTPNTDGNLLRLPRTTPLLVEASWLNQQATQTVLLEAAPDKHHELWPEVETLTLRTLAGDEYRLEALEQQEQAPTQAGKQPTCYVIMGFGKRTDFATGRTLDLDKTYKQIIKPAITAAGYECVRADEVLNSGVIDIPNYDMLYAADLVIADLSTANPNAIYELGAARPEAETDDHHSRRAISVPVRHRSFCYSSLCTSWE
jgi:hypothetical protein